MRKLTPFAFLVLLYLYCSDFNQITFLHKSVVSSSLYVVAIIVCASFIVNIRKETTSCSNN